jgi:hypothetical protein
MSQLTDKGYLSRLKEQRDFLRSDIEQYERGQAHFAFKLAGTLRTIFHKTEHSSPILPDLAERYGLQISFKGHRESQIDEFTVLYIGFQVGNLKPDFAAPFLVTQDFHKYWNATIYVEGKIRYTRKQLVLYAANKLGGTHVDPEIPTELLRIVEGNVILSSQSHKEEIIITRAVYETAYQILQILETLIPELERRISAKERQSSSNRP